MGLWSKTIRWNKAGRELEIALRNWAWGLGGGVWTETIQTVCGPRRRVCLALDVPGVQLAVTYQGRCNGR